MGNDSSQASSISSGVLDTTCIPGKPGTPSPIFGLSPDPDFTRRWRAPPTGPPPLSDPQPAQIHYEWPEPLAAEIRWRNYQPRPRTQIQIIVDDDNISLLDLDGSGENSTSISAVNLGGVPLQRCAASRPKKRLSPPEAPADRSQDDAPTTEHTATASSSGHPQQTANARLPPCLKYTTESPRGSVIPWPTITLDGAGIPKKWSNDGRKVRFLLEVVDIRYVVSPEIARLQDEEAWEINEERQRRAARMAALRGWSREPDQIDQLDQAPGAEGAATFNAGDADAFPAVEEHSDDGSSTAVENDFADIFNAADSDGGSWTTIDSDESTAVGSDDGRSQMVLDTDTVEYYATVHVDGTVYAVAVDTVAAEYIAAAADDETAEDLADVDTAAVEYYAAVEISAVGSPPDATINDVAYAADLEVSTLESAAVDTSDSGSITGAQTTDIAAVSIAVTDSRAGENGATASAAVAYDVYDSDTDCSAVFYDAVECPADLGGIDSSTVTDPVFDAFAAIETGAAVSQEPAATVATDADPDAEVSVSEIIAAAPTPYNSPDFVTTAADTIHVADASPLADASPPLDALPDIPLSTPTTPGSSAADTHSAPQPTKRSKRVRILLYPTDAVTFYAPEPDSNDEREALQEQWEAWQSKRRLAIAAAEMRFESRGRPLPAGLSFAAVDRELAAVPQSWPPRRRALPKPGRSFSLERLFGLLDHLRPVAVSEAGPDTAGTQVTSSETAPWAWAEAGAEAAQTMAVAGPSGETAEQKEELARQTSEAEMAQQAEEQPGPSTRRRSRVRFELPGEHEEMEESRPSRQHRATSFPELEFLRSELANTQPSRPRSPTFIPALSEMNLPWTPSDLPPNSRMAYSAPASLPTQVRPTATQPEVPAPTSDPAQDQPANTEPQAPATAPAPPSKAQVQLLRVLQRAGSGSALAQAGSNGQQPQQSPPAEETEPASDGLWMRFRRRRSRGG